MSEQQTQDGMKALVDQRLQVIKSSMPNVRQSIEDKVAQIGPEAYALVRRGLRGEPGCFYALEAGHVVGTPFGRSDPRMQHLAQFLVRFGCAYVCIFPMTDDEARSYGTA